MLPAVTWGCFCVGKRPLLLQNVFKLISQEISVDLTLCIVWSHPVEEPKKQKEWAPSAGC